LNVSIPFDSSVYLRTRSPTYICILTSNMDSILCVACGAAALVVDHHAGEIICSTCGAVQRDRLTAADVELDFFHSTGEEAVIESIEAPSHKEPAAWFHPTDWFQSSTPNLPALCQPAADKQPPPQVAGLKRIPDGEVVTEELSWITILIEAIGLSEEVEATAVEHYRLFLSKRLQRGKNRRGTVMAAIFHACQEHGATRTARELSIISGVPVSDIKRSCKHTTPFIERVGTGQIERRSVRADDIMSRYCRLAMAGKDSKDAKNLL
jgi:transcription initiation factor TFIIIB Brf1 subunit/transcription initiation factor TFIIB